MSLDLGQAVPTLGIRQPLPTLLWIQHRL